MAVRRPHSLQLGSKSFLEKSSGQRTPALTTLPQASPAETRSPVSSSSPAGDEEPAVHPSLHGHRVIRLGPQNRASRSEIWKTMSLSSTSQGEEETLPFLKLRDALP